MVRGLRIVPRFDINIRSFQEGAQGFGDEQMIDTKTVVLFKPFHTIIPPGKALVVVMKNSETVSKSQRQ
ncbi:hypothetical protein EVA_04980 [gut metagenome]|uniref:Uncharacterized protein n=1 Tax=gut metagenome TaxID=749906 RepID=J9GIE5_9ZZZZ